MTSLTNEERTKAEALTERICNAMVEAMDLISVYVGDRLGLYRALAAHGALTPGELARHAGIHPRYAREWLEQQAVTGIIAVDNAALAEDQRRYGLSQGHSAALAHPEGLFPNAAMAQAVIGIAQALPKVLQAYRTGTGVSWGDLGAEITEAQGGFNRPWLTTELGTKYLPAIPSVHSKLTSGPCKVADIACGVGWASIAIARAYPNAMVTGYDSDAASIALARRNAEKAGLADRVRFEVADSAHLKLREPFDLALVVEAVHDMSRPIEALAGIKRILKPGGTLIVADERVPDVFAAPGGFLDRLFYGASIVLCLPSSMSGEQGVGTGAVMRSSTLERYAKQAGFKAIKTLDLEHPTLQFYELHA